MMPRFLRSLRLGVSEIKFPASGEVKMKARSKNPTRSDQTTAKPVPSSLRRDMVLLAICVLLFCGIYVGKAYNMDDPLVLWTAQRIAAHPGDFYGFDVNWYGYSTPMELTDLNPPGAAYYAAIFGILFGWQEWAIHCGFALAAVALILGIYQLARQMGGVPLLAAVFALASPGVFISMGTVMTDIIMMSLWMWAIVLWMRGLDEGHSGANALSALLVGLAVLVKYFALSLVPLLLVYTIPYGRKRWARLFWLFIPLVMVGLFDLYTEWLYGLGQIRGILGLVDQYYQIYTVNHLRKFLTGLTFLGAGAAPALFIAPWLWRRKGRRTLWIGAIGVALMTVVLQQSGWNVGEPQVSFSWWFWPQYGLWLLAGIHIIALMVAEIWTQRDRDAVFLCLWLAGTLFYCIFVYHFVNIRVILPALPVIALVCARRLRRMREESRADALMMPKPAWAMLAGSLALCLAGAQADIRLANSAKTAAEKISREKRSGNIWFSGHWGFQYYMEARGAKPIDIKHQSFQLGDTIVTPMNASNRFLTRPRIESADQSFEVPVCGWISTMQADCGAGFYADLWGPLPFVLGPVPAERYQVTVLGRR
jgi:hypothetical protein